MMSCNVGVTALEKTTVIGCGELMMGRVIGIIHELLLGGVPVWFIAVSIAAPVMLVIYLSNPAAL